MSTRPDFAIHPDIDGPSPEDNMALAAILKTLMARHKGINGILMYGSCLRGGDLYDGLVDLYLIVDNYRDCYGTGALAIGNWLLPPNVFYAEATTAEGIVRSKYTIVSSNDFARGTSMRWFESYLWGRFSQPTRIVWSRDEASRKKLLGNMRQAVITFLRRSLPACDEQGTISALWEQALTLSYGTELRSEGSGRAAELVHLSGDYFDTVTELAADELPGLSVHTDNGQRHYSARIPSRQRLLAPWLWRLRSFNGKFLSLARLLKALFTFVGGLDYIAWKLERHSGQQVVVPDKVRRLPLIHIWGWCWQLYRRGVFK